MRALCVFTFVVTFAATARAELPSLQAASAQEVPKPTSAPGGETAKKPAKPAASPQASADKSASESVASKTDALVEPAGFTYNPEGRRDPFLSLVRRGVDPRGAGQATRPGGLAGLSVAEVTLRGTVRSREGFVAILQGADQRAYIVRPGDKLADGTIRTVTQNDVVILEQVNDPLSLDKQREVRKVLRQPEAN